MNCSWKTVFSICSSTRLMCGVEGTSNLFYFLVSKIHLIYHPWLENTSHIKLIRTDFSVVYFNTFAPYNFHNTALNNFINMYDSIMTYSQCCPIITAPQIWTTLLPWSFLPWSFLNHTDGTWAYGYELKRSHCLGFFFPVSYLNFSLLQPKS